MIGFGFKIVVLAFKNRGFGFEGSGPSFGWSDFAFNVSKPYQRIEANLLIIEHLSVQLLTLNT